MQVGAAALNVKFVVKVFFCKFQKSNSFITGPSLDHVDSHNRKVISVQNSCINPQLTFRYNLSKNRNRCTLICDLIIETSLKFQSRRRRTDSPLHFI